MLFRSVEVIEINALLNFLLWQQVEKISLLKFSDVDGWANAISVFSLRHRSQYFDPLLNAYALVSTFPFKSKFLPLSFWFFFFRRNGRPNLSFHKI